MKEFLLLFSSRTGVSICKKKDRNVCDVPFLIFNWTDATILISDYLSEENGTVTDYGLKYIVKIIAEDETSAISRSQNIVENIQSLLCLATLCHVNPAYLMAVLEKIPDSTVYPAKLYNYPFNYPESTSNLCLIEKEILMELALAFHSSQHRDRIQRALMWFRKGIDEIKLDEFISNWIGLEILSKILRQAYIGQVNQKDNWSGIKKVFEDYIFVTNDEFERIKENFRQGIFHGYKELSPAFVNEVENFSPTLRKGLIACICISLNVPDDTIRKTINKNVKMWKRFPYIKLQGNLENIPENLEQDIDSFPYFKYNLKNKSFEIKEDLVNYILEGSLEINCPESVFFSYDSYEVWSNERSSFKKVQFDLKVSD